MRDTHRIGDRAEAQCLAVLLRHYETVLIPFGNGRRYDLVVDDNGRFLRVQCKNGKLTNGIIEFNTASTTHRGGVTGFAHYRGQVDYFAVYCPQTDRVYWITAEQAALGKGRLRVEPTRNNQAKGILWAADFELRAPEEPTTPP